MWLLGMEIEGLHDWDQPDSELAFARNAFLPGLNGALRTAANDYGWHFVGGISDGFAGHGYCVGANDTPDPDRYVRTAAMSSVYQGPDQREKTTGTLHPNEAGHRIYRDRILDESRHRLSSVTPDHNRMYVFDRTPPTVSTTVSPAANSAGWHIASTTVRIDGKSPTAVVTTPQTGDVYVVGGPVAVVYSCADDRSGIASCTGEGANGDQLDTNSVGGHIFDVEAVDNAGNSSLESVPYKVTYDICPLFDQGKSYKSGQTVPVSCSCALPGTTTSPLLTPSWPQPS